MTRLHQFGRFLAALPARDHRWLASHVLETILLHLGQHPIDGALEAIAAAETVAESLGEQREPLPRGAVGEGGVDDAIGSRAVAVGDRALRRERDRNDGEPERRGEARVKNGHEW